MNIPEGYVLVPYEPTCDQLFAGVKTSGVIEIYKDMVSAAPALKITAYDEAKERELFTAFAMEHFLNIHKRDNGDYFYTETRIAWAAWKSCAKSRARSAE